MKQDAQDIHFLEAFMLISVYFHKKFTILN